MAKSKFNLKTYENDLMSAYGGVLTVLEKPSKRALLHLCSKCNTTWRAKPESIITPTGKARGKFSCPNCIHETDSVNTAARKTLLINDIQYKAPEPHSVGNVVSVIGFDPGTSNFGCFAGKVSLKDGKVDRVISKESAMMENRLVDMTTIETDCVNFAAELDSYLLTYKPDTIVIERFMTRGLKGATIELVNMMIGQLTDRVRLLKKQGKLKTRIVIITAATWKNQVNRVSNLDAIYELFRSRGVVDHKVDAALMSLYVHGTSSNPYTFLKDKRRRNEFFKSLINSQN
jgi:hypothetical protein